MQGAEERRLRRINNTPQGEATEGNTADDTLLVSRIAVRDCQRENIVVKAYNRPLLFEILWRIFRLLKAERGEQFNHTNTLLSHFLSLNSKAHIDFQTVSARLVSLSLIRTMGSKGTGGQAYAATEKDQIGEFRCPW